MKTINFANQNSLLGEYLREMRDVNTQNNRLVFRNNIHRIGEIMAYEISKTLQYKPVDTTTCLGVAHESAIADDVVLATVLRAGLPFHEGFLNFFDKAENAFVSAYRQYKPGSDEFEIKIEYIASPSIEGKVLLLVDPMLATGSSMELAYKALLTKGTPKHVHVASIIASQQAVDFVQAHFPDADTNLWVGAIDAELNAHSYIVPGLGDAGDLAYGVKE